MAVKASAQRGSDDHHYVKSQGRIDRINELVRRVKMHNDAEALSELIRLFEPLIQKVARHYFKQYGDLMPLEVLQQESRSQFCDLTLHTHIIGGPANFTTFINNFLFRRMQKYVAKERRFHYSHDRIDWAEMKHGDLSIAIPEQDRASSTEHTQQIKELLAQILESSYDGLLTELEIRVFEETVLRGSTDTDAATKLGLSRPYISRLHKIALKKIQSQFGPRWQLITKGEA